MTETINLSQILFLDIETVPQTSEYSELSDKMKLLWDKKAQKITQNPDETPTSIYPRAGIYAEFGKIICIVVGYFHENKFRIKSFSGDDEAKLLTDFAQMLDDFQKRKDPKLCGHNAKEFDFPYLCRRMIIHRIHIPEVLNASGKKPWETSFLDTMDMWRFGDYKNYTSIDLLTSIFGIQTPKDDIDGSMVCEYYWQRNELKTIVSYCKKDVLAVAQVYLRLQNLSPISEDQIVYVD
jgi:DNA polymerase elongation subunit (family B)